MCSEFITLASSCYLDNFALIAEVFERAFTLGIVIGTVVGVLLLFVNKINR